MLIFHEGLPGSGKSYEAMTKHVFPALQKGRHVFAYVEGLDHDKIAAVLELPADRVRELLHQLTREQVPDVYQHVENDSLVVIDELQNFWPSGRAKLPEKIVQFLTEHRHRGLDLLTMGQSLSDCHSMWRRRVDMRVVYLKRDAVGRPNEYTWRIFKMVDPKSEKFEQITSGGGKYEEKYFGTYASHTNDTSNTMTYADDRANIFKSALFRKWLPLAGVAGVLALGYMVYLFKFGGLAADVSKQPEAKKSENLTLMEQLNKESAARVKAEQALKGGALPGPVADGKPKEKEAEKRVSIDIPADFVGDLVSHYRPRLSGYIRAGSRSIGSIDFFGEGESIRERLTFQQLQGLGWLVLVAPDGSIATLQRGEVRVVVTAWPIDDGRTEVSERRQDKIRGPSKVESVASMMGAPEVPPIAAAQPSSLPSSEPAGRGHWLDKPGGQTGLK